MNVCNYVIRIFACAPRGLALLYVLCPIFLLFCDILRSFCCELPAIRGNSKLGPNNSSGQLE